MERSLEKAAKYFGLTRPKLIALMRDKGLLTDRIQLPVTTLDHSVKAIRYAHIKHVAALIDIRAYRADEDMPQRPQLGIR